MSFKKAVKYRERQIQARSASPDDTLRSDAPPLNLGGDTLRADAPPLNLGGDTLRADAPPLNLGGDTLRADAPPLTFDEEPQCERAKRGAGGHSTALETEVLR